MNSIAYYGNPWVGMFAKTNNSITIVPVDAQDKMIDIITETWYIRDKHQLRNQISPVCIA